METGEVLVIDLFAGPGGLGEGVSSCVHENGNKPFQIGVSVEKEPSAHKTLTTRAFYRKIKELPNGKNDYYDYTYGKITRDELFTKYPNEYESVRKETLEGPKALGEDNALIHERIRMLTSEHQGPKVVIGGPPCQAYSLAGRSRNTGIKDYKAEKDHRNFLYMEYLKVLSIAQPDVFVMENVRGILSAKLNGKVMFPQILKDLRKPGKVTNTRGVPGYRIYSLVVDAENPNNPQYRNSADFLIRSELYGIPQARHRVILIGVREDNVAVPNSLVQAENTINVESILSDLPALRSGFSKQTDDVKIWTKTVTKHAKQLKQIFAKNYSKEQIAKLDLEPLEKLQRKSTQHANIQENNIPQPLKNWLLDENLGCVLNHETRGHMEADLLRYAFCSSYAKLNAGTSPKSRDFPTELAPNHQNWTTGTHADRFRVQSANKYATTVTSHISKDGHYFVHYDPKQCRSLTVREAARLQTFPDNYLFEGNRTQQYVQVGNAVPPFLAQQIAAVVLKLLC
ncbi:DNA cytosine methyltransferase [Moritella viscosa]|uniref:Cytosine-specific methyltransferase n=1 Tax=Moritella viscosa TaxID=80854 RepID=A0A1L0BNA6_9GAMM|nr:DNA (cytosine-5-)-methyltransferase [Moritella viscosa]SGZ05579.1 Modification methylase (Cytosine-specific methyltransferase) [Moritella viscosa]SHO13409.1 Modification methylase (Cytosine-specific methyltransferase) [Moritella viscosa]SHO14498.1 Modification methylase (Cytosine-specific methyltransferase) [Moritella viscosa]SHO18993.1 Modification methylase (Cytosine-specific methyltransferase) [Moritella viscosa]